MKWLCGYCRLRPAITRGWCDLCRFAVEHTTGMAVSKIPAVLWHPAPAPVEVDRKLTAWIAAQEHRQ